MQSPLYMNISTILFDLNFMDIKSKANVNHELLKKFIYLALN
jgi:hypothetical protein